MRGSRSITLHTQLVLSALASFAFLPPLALQQRCSYVARMAQKTRREIVEDRRRSLQRRTGFGEGLWGPLTQASEHNLGTMDMEDMADMPFEALREVAAGAAAVHTASKRAQNLLERVPHAIGQHHLAMPSMPHADRAESLDGSARSSRVPPSPLEYVRHVSCEASSSQAPVPIDDRGSSCDTSRADSSSFFSGGASFYTEPAAAPAASSFISPSLADFKNRTTFAQANAVLKANSPQPSPKKPPTTPEHTAARAQQRVHRSAADSNHRALRGETAQTTEVGLGVDPIVAAAVEELRTINGEVETLAKEIHELESAIASRGSSRGRSRSSSRVGKVK